MTKDIKESAIYKSIKSYVTEHNIDVNLDYIINELGATKNFEVIDKFVQDLGLECIECGSRLFLLYFRKDIDGYLINFGMKKSLGDKMCWTFWILLRSNYDNVYNITKSAMDNWPTTSTFPAELKKFNLMSD